MINFLDKGERNCLVMVSVLPEKISVDKGFHFVNAAISHKTDGLFFGIELKQSCTYYPPNRPEQAEGPSAFADQMRVLVRATTNRSPFEVLFA